MFYVNGNPILASELEILQELKNQLAINGVDRFNTFIVGAKNIQTNCPVHKDGQERKPSCGITTEPVGEMPAGTVHCFTCGYTATLEEMISNCFGKNDMGRFGTEWLVKNFLTISIESRKPLQIDFSRGKKTKYDIPYVPESELDSYRFYHEYMYVRRLTDEIIEKFDVGYDKHFELGGKVLRTLTFPVRDKTGQTLFVARRSVDHKIFHYPEGVDKPVYGVYELSPDASEVLVCESILNALTAEVYGSEAVALLGLGTANQYEQLRQLPCRKIISAFDADSAGDRATEKLKQALSPYKLITRLDIPKGKDINDLSYEEFSNLQEIF